MKIAAGTARGLEYLHDKASPPVIYQRYKPSNILVDEGFHPKLSDFGLVTLGSVGDKSHVSTHVIGTYGYCAPQCATTGQLTLKSNVCSFGVVLLELNHWVMYRPNVHLIGAQDAFKKAVTVYENAICSTALDNHFATVEKEAAAGKDAGSILPTVVTG
ncbi:unnamed protein product [Sphagnum troendelagicum]